RHRDRPARPGRHDPARHLPHPPVGPGARARARVRPRRTRVGRRAARGVVAQPSARRSDPAPTMTHVPITTVWPGRPYPLGATWDGEGVNFALHTRNATGVVLAIFDTTGRRQVKTLELRERTDDVW